MTVSALRATYPAYHIVKKKISLDPGTDVDAILSKLAEQNTDASPDLRDGVKLDFPEYWVHFRKSNTEPIIRVYAEAADESKASEIADSWIEQIRQYL